MTGMEYRWRPDMTRDHYGPPPVGRLLAHQHAVWRVVKVIDLPLSDEDRDQWLDAGMPDLAAWTGRPHKIHVDHVAGVRPDWAPEDGPVPPSAMTVPATKRYSPHRTYLYPDSGRWPSCGCCGEPMPCTAEMRDRLVTHGQQELDKFTKKIPGCCWGCNEPITQKQKVVIYEGDNLDLPGGPEVRFHARNSCHYAAQKYELRWIAVDPRRERVITWPKCGGILVVHGDGSSECQTGQGPLGGMECEGEPGCRGHLTHDHGTQRACYVGDAWLASRADMPGCPRGCSFEEHPGTRTTRRPARKPFAAPPLFGAS